MIIRVCMQCIEVDSKLLEHAQQHGSNSFVAGNQNPAPGEYNVSLKVTHKRALAASLQGRESHGEQQQQQLLPATCVGCIRYLHSTHEC